MFSRWSMTVALLALCFALAACAGQEYNNPDLLAQARVYAEADITGLHVWGDKPSRVSASVTPESTAMFPAISGNVSLTAVYRNYESGETRFAISMAQGTRLGTCLRSLEGDTEFKVLSPLAVMGDLVRASFFSIDDFFASAPQAADIWSLRNGDVHGGIDKQQIVLVRRRNLQTGSYAHFVYDLMGRPIVFYQVSGQSLDWRLNFKEGGKRPAFIFRDYRYDWIINVQIVEAAS